MFILSDMCRKYGISGADIPKHITIQEHHGFANFVVDGKLEARFKVTHVNNGTVSSVRFTPV